MPQDREASPEAAPPAVDLRSVTVSETDGRRRVTAAIGSGPAASRGPIAAAQELLHSLYRGRPAARPGPAAETTSATPAPEAGSTSGTSGTSSGAWWNPFGGSSSSTAQAPEVKPSPSGWAQTEQGGARADRSAEYRTTADAAKAGTNQLPPDAKDYIYLVVPGLFTEHYPGYMNDNMARMKKLGLDARMVTIDTDASVEDNAKIIRDAINEIAKAEGKEVVLIGHSKGGVDATAAIAQYPELYEHVHAVIAMQTPYGGTPVASDIAGNARLLGLVGSAIKRLFSGDQRALTDLTYQARQEFVRAHPYDTARMPTISYGTTGGPTVSTVGPAASYMRNQYGLESDGLVPKKDAVVPGSDVVYANDQDHASPVMSAIGRGQADVPADIVEALITLALRRASEMEAAEGGGPRGAN
ncbi:MAG: hypothetical protein IPL61_09615 [Myxococcales bacterium]|nr:hypothetical protein [Myxococcales bacterium]